MAISDEKILQAAVDVISERGYAGATTKQIASRAGINEVTLFRRFGNKKNVMRSVVEREAKRLGDLNIRYSGDLVADLIQIVEVYQELMQRRGRVMLMLMSEIPRQPDLLEIAQVPQAQARRFASILTRYQAEGQLIQEPPMLALGSLIGPIFSASMLRSLEPDLARNLADAAQLVDRFLHGRRA